MRRTKVVVFPLPGEDITLTRKTPSSLSFFLNKYFTFESKKWEWKQVYRFALNIAICYFIAYGIAKPFTLFLLKNSNERVQTNVAMLVGMVFFTGLNYFGQRLFAFKKQ